MHFVNKKGPETPENRDFDTFSPWNTPKREGIKTTKKIPPYALFPSSTTKTKKTFTGFIRIASGHPPKIHEEGFPYPSVFSLATAIQEAGQNRPQRLL